LLDISNNDEYKWTNIFNLTTSSETTSTSSTPSTPKYPTEISTKESTKLTTIIGTVVGSLFGDISLLLGRLFIYERNKNKRKNKKTPGNDEINNYNHKDLTIPAIRIINDHEKETISTINNIHNYGQEILQISGNKYLTNNEVYYHGREATPSVDNQNPLSENESLTNNKVYNDEKGVTPNDNQNPSSQNIDNVLESFKNEMLQVIRQEMQNLRQEITQNSSNTINK